MVQLFTAIYSSRVINSLTIGVDDPLCVVIRDCWVFSKARRMIFRMFMPKKYKDLRVYLQREHLSMFALHPFYFL